ncbi:MAG TPA: UTP--glucose-1-phosphate uridylyltransferase, partial [Planococcus sp. (in: firmicutes)]|nr:UTP--glucose-1-phosphate uridylyltransferase [Planococcus sp. (in: firmicutes)]
VQPVYAYEFDGRRYDVGEKFGFIETTIEFALKRPELRNQLLELFQAKLEEEAVRKE